MGKEYTFFNDFAWLFDAEHGDSSRGGDREFYLDAAKTSGGPVLELACGMGRVLAPILRSGLDVYGIDKSPAMIELARTRLSQAQGIGTCFTLAWQDQASFKIPRKFPLIILPWNSYLNLTDAQFRHECISRIREHLAPGGRLVMDIELPELEARVTPWGQWVLSRSGTRARSRTRFKPRLSCNLIEKTIEVEIDSKDGVERKEASHCVAHLHAEEVLSEVASSGLEISSVSTDFKGTKLASKGRAMRLVLTAHHPENTLCA